MGNVGGLRRQHDLRVGGHLDPTNPSTEVRERDPAYFRVVLPRDDHVERGRDRTVAPDDLDALLGVRDLVRARLDAARLIAGGPDLAAIHVAEEEIAAEVISRDV